MPSESIAVTVSYTVRMIMAHTETSPSRLSRVGSQLFKILLRVGVNGWMLLMDLKLHMTKHRLCALLCKGLVSVLAYIEIPAGPQPELVKYSTCLGILKIECNGSAEAFSCNSNLSTRTRRCYAPD